jgi:exodeoxyribonuclease VII large subunit
MQDVLANARERWPSIAFEIREVPVQGAQAVSAVTEAVTELDRMPDVDVIIVTRGGGSVEDLLPFSNETLVRAVAACTTPVVSAIGHEQDAPLLDHVADLRASTPTDAAKRVVPSLAEQQALILGLRDRTARVMRHLLDSEQQTLNHRRQRARSVVISRIDASASDVSHLAARVRALSPAATLDRGYAIVLTEAGEIVRDADAAPIGTMLDIRLARGRIRARREMDRE